MSTEVHVMDAAASMALWPDIEPFVAAALARDPWESTTTQEVAEQLASDDALLLVAVDQGDILGAAVVQLFNLRTGKVVYVLTTAGDKLDLWVAPMVERLLDLAVIYGADHVTMTGRPGWARALRKYGFKTDQIQMKLEVANVRRQEQAKAI